MAVLVQLPAQTPHMTGETERLQRCPGNTGPAEADLPPVERLFRWPGAAEQGEFVITCGCLRWAYRGTVSEIGAAARAHDDSPWTNHIVGIWGKVSG